MELNNDMKINEYMSIDNTHNSPTLVINKPSDKEIALNFPSVDYVEKPSSNFSLTINDIIADTANFDETQYNTENIFVDIGKSGSKNTQWAFVPDLDNGYRVNDEYTELYSNTTHDDCYANPIYEFSYDDDCIIEFDYLKVSDNNKICFIDDFDDDPTYNIDSWTMSELGITTDGRVKIVKNGTNVDFFLNNTYLTTETFTLDGKYRFYFNFNDNTFRYKNFIMYGIRVLHNTTPNESLVSPTYFKLNRDLEDFPNYMMVSDNTILIDNSLGSDELLVTPIINDNEYFLYNDTEINLNINYILETENIYLEFFNNEGDTQTISFSDIYEGDDTNYNIKIIDNKIIIKSYDGTDLINTYTDDFLLTDNYAIRFKMDTNSGLIYLYGMKINNVYMEWEDLGVVSYNNAYMVGSQDAIVESDIYGTTLQSKRNNGKAYLIPTVDGDFNTPLIMKYTSNLEFDYIYNVDPNSNNSIMVINRLGSQSETIRFNDLEIQSDKHIKVKVTNEFEQVGTEDMTANIKVYLADINDDDIYVDNDYTLVFDKDVSISLLRAGYYYAFKQQYADSIIRYRNYKIKKIVYDYNVEVICRGYNENGVIDMFNIGEYYPIESEVKNGRRVIKVDTAHNSLKASFKDIPSDVKYIDFLIIFRDSRLNKIEISRIMLSDGIEDAPYSLDKKTENLNKININFNRNYYCNYYNSSSSDPVGLCIIRPTMEDISLTKLYAPKKTDGAGNQGVTVLYPYLKNAKEENKPENVGIEYLNSCYQTLKLIYNG